MDMHCGIAGKQSLSKEASIAMTTAQSLEVELSLLREAQAIKEAEGTGESPQDVRRRLLGLPPLSNALSEGDELLSRIQDPIDSEQGRGSGGSLNYKRFGLEPPLSSMSSPASTPASSARGR